MLKHPCVFRQAQYGYGLAINLGISKIFLLLTFNFLLFTSYAQIKHKIIIIPFEPKLYMSQIDHKINAETKLNQKEIKEAYRKGINAELAKSLKQKYEVLDLLKDTAKYKKDILNIYKNITFSYEKVPDQSHYKTPVQENTKKNESIKNGQILVETNPDARFMNVRVTSPALVPALYAKYKTDLFLFINQLDVFAGELTASDLGMVSERILTIHYTVFTVDAKEINSGTCSIKFPADLNNPSRIISNYISKVSAEITGRIARALSKIEAAPKKQP
jgi:hypothetical protein